tara:strand:+ start:5255 stop:5464 length:210 start_codon:yes stop_codon:yes gene_type:complete
MGQTLQDYRNDNDMTIDQLCAQLGIARNTVTSLLYGHRQPSMKMALLIEDRTGGQVTPRSWDADKAQAS